MDVVVYLVGLVLGGLIIGALARLLVPGRDPMSLLGTIVLGISAALVAGLLTELIFDRSEAGFLISLAVAIVIVLVLRRNDSEVVGAR